MKHSAEEVGWKLLKKSYLSIVYFKESHIDFQVLISVPGLVEEEEDILC